MLLSRRTSASTGLLAGCYLLLAGCASTPGGSPFVQAASSVEAGRYLVIVGSCNDCHTHNYMAEHETMPEEQWLAGSDLGFLGPWGVTYPQNLRLRAQEWTEDIWVATLQNRKERLPMPWMNVNQMSEADARAIYRYLRSLGPYGEHAPVAVPPDQPITTQYVSIFPIEPE